MKTENPTIHCTSVVWSTIFILELRAFSQYGETAMSAADTFRAPMRMDEIMDSGEPYAKLVFLVHTYLR